MRRMLFLAALSLAGCVTPPGRPQVAGDPLFGGNGSIPATGPARRDDDDGPAPRVPAPPPSTSVGASPAALTVGPGPGVTLGNPRASVAASGPSSSSILPAGGPAPATYEQIQAKLKVHGVDWQVLTQRGPDSWHFLCAVPDAKRPHMRVNHETERPCPTPLAAMEAVLRKIESAPRQ